MYTYKYGWRVGMGSEAVFVVDTCVCLDMAVVEKVLIHVRYPVSALHSVLSQCPNTKWSLERLCVPFR